MNCFNCGVPFEQQDLRGYRYCQPCRYAYGRELQQETETFPPPKGRDRITERLTDGFRMLYRDYDGDEARPYGED